MPSHDPINPRPKMGRLLIVDDDAKTMTALSDALGQQGYETVGFTTAAKALEVLQRQEFDVLLTDLQMPEMDGITLLKTALAVDPHLVPIVMTGQGTIQTAVKAMQHGAFDYVEKPLKMRDLLPTLARALEVRQLRRENLQLRETLGIYELCVAVGFTLDIDTILNKVMDAALQQCGADEVSILLPTLDGKELYVATARGARRELIQGQRVALDQGIAGWVASHREPLILNGQVHDARFAPVHPRQDIQSAISTPMMVGGRCVGVLNVNATQPRRPFTLGQVKALTILTGTAAPALQAASLHAQVQADKEEWEQSFNALTDYVCVLDRSGTIVRANKAMRDRFEPIHGNLLGLDYRLVYCGTATPDPPPPCASVLESGVPVVCEGAFPTLEGWYLVSCNPLFDRAGSQWGAVFVVHDITQRKRDEETIRETQARFVGILNIAEDAIVSVGEDQRIVVFNQGAEKIFGYTAQEVMGQSLDLLLTPDDATGHSKHLRDFATAPQTSRGMGQRRQVFGRRKDGTLFPAEASISKLTLGAQTTFTAILRDVTERRQAEADLARRGAILTATTDFVLIADAKMQMVYCNPASRRTLGIELDEDVTRLGVADIFSPAVYQRLLNDVFPQVSRDGTWSGELTFRSRAGKEIPTELVGLSHLGSDGTPQFFSAIARDITERRRAASRLAARSEVTGILAEATTVQEMTGKVLPVICQTTGWHMGAVWTPDKADNVLRCVGVYHVPQIDGEGFEVSTRQSAFAPGIGLPGRVWVSGQPVWISDAALDSNFSRAPAASKVGLHSAFGFPLRLGHAVLGVMEFFSTEIREPDSDLLEMFAVIGSQIGQFIERQRSKEMLHERTVLAFLTADVGLAFTKGGSLRQMLQAGVESMVHNLEAAFARIWTLNDAEQVLELQASAGMYTHLDGPHSRVPVGKFKIGLIAAEKKPHLTNDVANDPRIGDPEWARQEGMVAFAGYPLLLENRPVGVMAMFARKALSETTLQAMGTVANQIALGIERKRAEESLRQSETQLRQVWDKSLDGMRLTDAQGIIRLANDAFCRIVGMPREALEGNPLTIIYAQEQQAQLLADHRQRFASNHIQTQFTKEVTLWNGRKAHFDVSNSFLELRGQSSQLLTIIRDVTDHKQMETQLRQAQKMEAFGQLAGGVAHDFNNLLTIITGYSEMLLTGTIAADKQRDFIREIRKAGERAGSLTRQLLAFSRKQLLQPVELELNGLIRETEKLLRRLIGEDIDMATKLDPALAWVKADPGQLEQVIMNLVVNARDAMPTGGLLTIETQNVDLDQDYAQKHADIQPGKYAMLAVTDSGCGMDEATRTKIFEPFFTTKEVGKGTGLGLATVHGIVKQSGGSIEVYSEVGRGTTFKIYLPRIKAVVSSGKSLAGVSLIPRGTETILLAEDDEGVRATVRLVLESSGYTVLAARNGEEALQICQQRVGPIHLLMTDVVMPKMSGRQLAEFVVAARPQIKVLYLSGYTDDAVVRHGVLEAGMAFLQKPFTPMALARKVREVLGAYDTWIM